MARSKKEETKIIGIPVDKIEIVEKLLGRSLATKQTPIVKIRVPKSMIKKIRELIK